MQLTGNTILITGGGTGIGRGLAEFFHAEGNQVIIAGRRKGPLDEATAANPGMKSVTLDVGDAASVESFSRQIVSGYPALNAVILNAGIMPTEVLSEGKVADAEATFATNLLGPVRLGTMLLPHLIAQPVATIMTVTSGLAFVPLALNPAYCASKAAIHSWTQSLRYQLKETAVQVLELIPPYVQTELAGERQLNDPMAMPLKDFLAEMTGILKNSPDATEIIVERVKPLRFAEASGGYDALYEKFNETMATARAKK